MNSSTNFSSGLIDYDSNYENIILTYPHYTHLFTIFS